MTSIIPFKIDVPEKKIVSLKQKLARSDYPSEITDVEPWTRGPPLADIKRLAQFWQHDFHWRDMEAKLNQLPQYTVGIEIEGHGTKQVHFVHQPSTLSNAIPLLFVHGWPGSFVEVTKILPQLVQGGDYYPAFHVVAPSRIDFGFSSASKKKGFNIDQQAEACHKLMQTLGYHEYVVQDGDFGSAVALSPRTNSRNLSSLHAQVQATALTDEEKVGLQRSEAFGNEGNAFYKLQSSRPLTLSYSLSSSPIGLLAWIYEKLHDWTDAYPWSDTEILTWVSIYYFSRAGPSASLNIYYESEHRSPQKPLFAEMQSYTPNVPLGISRFPKDLILLPKLWHHTMGQVAYQSEHDHGGHFPAWECPDTLVENLRAMFGKGGGAYACIGQRSGNGAASGP